MSTPPTGAQPTLPLMTRVAMFVRLLAVQCAWNYETLVGNGIVAPPLAPLLTRLAKSVQRPA